MPNTFSYPLPEHTKINYEECFVKLLLEDMFPERYQNLILTDKPDLIDEIHNIGIEITSAIPKHRQEAFNLWRTMPYQSEERQSKRKERMKQLGAEYQAGTQIWPVLGELELKEELDELFGCFENKIRKLNNGHYTQHDRYDLFIISELWLDDKDYTMILQEFTKKNNLNLGYTLVYLVTLDNICIFHLYEKKYTTVEVSHQKSYEWAVKARQLIETREQTETTNRR